MKIISVIPLKKGIPKGDLTYFTVLDISPGSIVSIPIKSKKTLALVVSSEELKDRKSNVKGMDFSLRKVTENKGSSVFLKEFMDTIFDTGKYFTQNKNNAVASLIPNIFLEEYDKIKNISAKDGPWGNSLKARPSLKTEKLLFQYPFSDRVSVYKTLIRESFARGKSVFMVLPTEIDINNFAEQLSKGIEQFVFAVSSGMSPQKNLAIYEKIMASSHPVLILGTAPFLSIPKKDIGTIILEHENSNAYKTIRRPHLDLRVFTEIYASKINAKLIIADEMLRFETIGRKDMENLNPLYPLSFRIDFLGEIEISNKGQKEDGKKFQVLKSQSTEGIKSALKDKKSVFIFSLRKGLATETLCRDCGETVSCGKCGTPLVLYLSHRGKKRMFVCNRCGEEKSGDTACASCGSWNLVPLGIGTDTVQEEAKKLFPKIKIFKLDKESAKTGRGAQKIIKEFESNPGSILIGTEMAFFYLKNKIPLSIIASFDSLWSIPNFRMSEKIIQIVFSMIGNTSEKLIIQTKNEKDEVIRAIESENFLPFVRGELEERKKFGYPPFKRFIKITYLGDKEQTKKAKETLKEIFKEYSPEIFSGFVAQLKNKYVTNALLKIDPSKWSLPEISHNSSIDEILLDKLLYLPSNFEILVDPEDLL